jgi:RNA polymerase sigma-70 factor (family 1)
MATVNYTSHADNGGEENLFNELVVTHTPALFTDITAITKCRHSAADILQDTFLKLWSKRESITYENPGGWLYRVAVHAAYKHLKKESKKRKLFEEFKTDNEPVCSTAENRMINKEQQLQLEDIITRLPQMQKKVFRLSREAGLTRDEIASKLDISRNTVKVHLTRAQRFLKEQLNAVGLFLLFFGLNIFCSVASNTKSGFEDLYNTEKEVLKMLPEKNKNAQFNGNKHALFTIADKAKAAQPVHG